MNIVNVLDKYIEFITGTCNCNHNLPVIESLENIPGHEISNTGRSIGSHIYISLYQRVTRDYKSRQKGFQPENKTRKTQGKTFQFPEILWNH